MGGCEDGRLARTWDAARCRRRRLNVKQRTSVSHHRLRPSPSHPSLPPSTAVTSTNLGLVRLADLEQLDLHTDLEVLNDVLAVVGHSAAVVRLNLMHGACVKITVKGRPVRDHRQVAHTGHSGAERHDKMSRARGAHTHAPLSNLVDSPRQCDASSAQLAQFIAA